MKRLLLAMPLIAYALASAPIRADDKTAPMNPGQAADPFQNSRLWRTGDIPPTSGYGREAQTSLKERRAIERQKRMNMAPGERAAAKAVKHPSLQR